MKNLIIIGARGYGREVYYLAKDCQDARKEFVVKGFLDDKEDALAAFEDYPPIISPVESYEPGPDDVFICALGKVDDKIRYSQMISDKGGTFTSLVHPAVRIPKTTTLGVGCIIWEYVVVSSGVSIGNFVDVQTYSVIGHDCTVGDWCHLGPFVFLGGKVKIGNGAQINPRAAVLPRITIGTKAVVGTGSVVIRHVKPNTTVFGNPAKKTNL